MHLETTKKTCGTNTCEYIILHDTASDASAESNAKYLASNPAPASCHYVVGEDGRVWKIGEDTDILWHAGISSWNGKKDMNRYSIGIEIHANKAGDSFTSPQRAATKKLVQSLMQDHKIPPERVIRHKDIAPKRKTDVRDAFWRNEFKTFKDYQKSLTETTMNLHNETIMLLKDLWSKQNAEDKKKIGDLANKHRAAEKALGLHVTK